MSILIHGVSMPKDGKVLLIDPWGNVRSYWSKDVVAVGTGLHLCKASELQPHGRLIDADDIENITVIMNESGTGFNRIIAPIIIQADPNKGGADG